MTITGKIIFVIVIMFGCATMASANDLMSEQAQLYGANELKDLLPDDAALLMSGQDPTKETDILQSFYSVFFSALDNVTDQTKGAIVTVVQTVLVIAICQISDSICTDKGKMVVSTTAALAIAVNSIGGLHAMIGLGRETIGKLMDYSDVLLPSMVAAATASGSVTRAGAIYTLAVVLSNLIVRFINYVLLPAVYASVILALVDALTQQERLKRLREFVGFFIEKTLKGSIYLFVAFITLTGIVSGNTDTALVRAVKATISGAVPVVGTIISSAAGGIFSTAGVLKNTIGVFGILALFAIFITPFLKIGISGIAYKIMSAISGVFESKQSSFLEAISSSLGHVIAMVGASVFICMLSCFCLLGVTQL